MSCIICYEKNYHVVCKYCKNSYCRNCILDSEDDMYPFYIELVAVCIQNTHGYCGYLYNGNDVSIKDKNWNWLYGEWFCTETCMIKRIIEKEELSGINYFALKNKPNGFEELCNRQHNIWLKIMIDRAGVMINNLLNIVHEYAINDE